MYLKVKMLPFNVMVENFIFGFADSVKIHIHGILGRGGLRSFYMGEKCPYIQLMEQHIP